MPATLDRDDAAAEHSAGRFGIVTSEEGPQGCVASVPAAGMTSPLTGLPTIAMLVDHIGGLTAYLG